jgi:hypothetical protein
MGLETCDCEAFGHFNDCVAHAASGYSYASEGGTCFLKLNWAEFGESSDGYIK